MKIKLPPPSGKPTRSFEKILLQRRSCREFSRVPLTLQQLSRLLWACQGITAQNRARSAPSAAAQYPVQVYIVAPNIEQLAVGIYHFDAVRHQLTCLAVSDIQQALCAAALMPTALICIAGRKQTLVEPGEK